MPCRSSLRQYITRCHFVLSESVLKQTDFHLSNFTSNIFKHKLKMFMPEHTFSPL